MEKLGVKWNESDRKTLETEEESSRIQFCLQRVEKCFSVSLLPKDTNPRTNKSLNRADPSPTRRRLTPLLREARRWYERNGVEGLERGNQALCGARKLVLNAPRRAPRRCYETSYVEGSRKRVVRRPYETSYAEGPRKGQPGVLRPSVAFFSGAFSILSGFQLLGTLTPLPNHF
ncbi:hypothetical protein LR48_Vigan10g064800 [Vigna angularis]|uniref:Uncharacterized protein n=1 Tax=Phaseolus angularis TaxID=3914 RepID=A0A0L9VI72_PHAAN|nr:hypothetical protein LR48_Vigan10g064800 [Vigna angularis]